MFHPPLSPRIDIDTDISGGLDGGGDREGAVNALNIRALWGGGGARVGDLLYHLLRGRKDHMTRVKVRTVARCCWMLDNAVLDLLSAETTQAGDVMSRAAREPDG